MGRREQYRQELAATADRVHFLREHSGLPGARANIELGQAAADVGDAAWFDELIGTGDEYLVFCGVLGLGRRLAEGHGVEERLREHARDDRWRVREAVAMALQRLGDTSPERLMTLARDWVADADPLVRRAAVGGICEPRLLTTAEMRACALEVCERATLGEHGCADRVLRKALGYCWSVAVAADPAAGVPMFRRLAEVDDPDVAWIVRENAKKARMPVALRGGANATAGRRPRS